MIEDIDEYLKKIGRENEPLRHKYYDKSVKCMKQMGVHMTGDDPKELLDIKRPNEQEEAKEYRLKSYKPKTKAAANRVTSVINRIYNERLFSIEYKDDPVKTIGEGKGLGDYLSNEMPLYISLTNYIKSILTKMHLKDANGLLAVLPMSYEKEDTDYMEPIPIFYTAKELVDFEDGEYYTILLEEGQTYQKTQDAIIIDREYIRIYHREQGKKWESKFEDDGFKHNIYFNGQMIAPAFRIRGVVSETEEPQLFESFISGVLPHWDDATCMYSDLQAVIVNNVYPEKWEFTVNCQDCKGKGKVSDKDFHGEACEVPCRTCGGSGLISTKGPFSIYQINRDALNPDATLPIPPFGTGEKELDSTRLLDELAEKEIQKGYAAINMDILNNVGEDQSGIAKTIDRQDLDGFLEVYASHMFKFVIPNMIWLIELWRYRELLNDNQLNEYFPNIKPPSTFDVYSISLLTQEFANMKEAGVTGPFLTGIQKDIMEKRFSDEYTKKFYTTIIDIDPLSHMTNEDLLANSRVIGREELFIHAYAKDLVEDAITQNDNFLNETLEDKKMKIRELAKSKLSQVQIDVQDNG